MAIRVNLGSGTYWNQRNLNQVLGAIAMNISSVLGRNASSKFNHCCIVLYLRTSGRIINPRTSKLFIVTN